MCLECAGCGEDIRSGQSLLALEKQWHLWCFTCTKCGCLLAGEYMGRSEDSQILRQSKVAHTYSLLSLSECFFLTSSARGIFHQSGVVISHFFLQSNEKNGTEHTVIGRNIKQLDDVMNNPSSQSECKLRPSANHNSQWIAKNCQY